MVIVEKMKRESERKVSYDLTSELAASSCQTSLSGSTCGNPEILGDEVLSDKCFEKN